MIIKVADFGLAEDIYTARYFRMEKGNNEDTPSLLPIKWTALEGIHDGIFSEKSDIVSGYGKLMNEAVTETIISFSGHSGCYAGKCSVLVELLMVECLTWKLFECLIQEKGFKNLTILLAMKKCKPAL